MHVSVQITDTIEPIKGGELITLGQRGVVEHRFHEVIELAAQRHNRLPNVQQLAGAFADDMDAKNGMRLPVKNNFQAPGSIAADLSTGDFAIVGYAYLVRNVLFGKLLLGFPDERNLRNRIDAV